MNWKSLQLLTATALLAVSLPAASLTLTPATVSGAPGTTTGWGFELLNDTSNWIVINSVTDSGFNPAFGTFTEYAASSFFVFAPNSIAPVGFPFSLSTLEGFGQFAIAPGVTVGDFSTGSFRVGYDTYSSDPLVDFGAGFITGDNYFDISFARVDAVAPIPEPATVALSGAALLALLSVRRRS